MGYEPRRGVDAGREVDSTRAVVFAVDDHADDLAVLRHELQKRYGADYDVRTESSPTLALEALEELRTREHPVALVLADQWMAEMPGTEFLGRAHASHPTAKRCLLIRWGDRAVAEPILQAMALGRFDYYIPKPAAPPDERFHAVVEGFLADWAREQSRGFAPVVLVGEPSTARVHELRDLLTRNGLLHRVLTPESTEGAAVLREAGVGLDAGPVVFILDAPPIVDPSNAAIADALGVNTSQLRGTFDVVIVGAGPAGLGAAVYSASEGLDTLVIEREALGGQAATSSRIRNFLGFPTGVTGRELAIRAYEQAWLFGAKFHFMHEAVALRPDADSHAVTLSDGTVIVARTVVLATGVRYRRLGIPALEQFSGSGVFYGAAVSEAPAVRGQRVFVAGGGNSAGQAAIHLAKYAESVTILVRGRALAQTMSEYLITEIGASAVIDVQTQTSVTGGDGRGRLETLSLRNAATGRTREVPADALFVLIGAEPHTDWLPPEIARDEWGFVVAGPDLARRGNPDPWPLARPPMLLETSAPGVFVVGDVRHRSIKRVAAAVGEGSICVTLVHDYLTSTLEEHP